MKRRDNGQGYEDYLIGLAKASGIETPARQDLARIDRKRPKKGSNEDWRSPTDTDAQIMKMKDGRTHLAHKQEHAVDMDTGAVLGVTLAGGAAHAAGRRPRRRGRREAADLAALQSLTAAPPRPRVLAGRRAGH